MLNVASLVLRLYKVPSEVKPVLIGLTICVAMPALAATAHYFAPALAAGQALHTVGTAVSSVVGFLDTDDIDLETLNIGQTWPAKGIVSDEFGTHGPVRKKLSLPPHTGIDIYNAPNTVINTFAKGRVIETDEKGHGACGKYVLIEHDHNIRTQYCHLSSVTVIENEQVPPHRQIGFMGTTGISTGVHLHFVVSYKHAPFNPRVLLNGNPNSAHTQALDKFDYELNQTNQTIVDLVDHQ